MYVYTYVFDSTRVNVPLYGMSLVSRKEVGRDVGDVYPCVQDRESSVPSRPPPLKWKRIWVPLPFTRGRTHYIGLQRTRPSEPCVSSKTSPPPPRSVLGEVRRWFGSPSTQRPESFCSRVPGSDSTPRRFGHLSQYVMIPARSRGRRDRRRPCSLSSPMQTSSLTPKSEGTSYTSLSPTLVSL